MKYNTQNAKIKSITEKTLIVGIDVGSETHFARAFDWRNYEYSKKPLEFSNTEAGFMTLKAWMADFAEKYGKNVVIPGMEPTGHYWFNLGAYLQDNGMKPVHVNPHHVKKSKELDDNSPKKTDLKDPKTIAKLVIDGRYSFPYVPEGIYAEIREVTSSRDRIMKELNAASNRIQRWLKIYFPEYLTVYKKFDTTTGMMILEEVPLPTMVTALGVDNIIKIWREHKVRGKGASFNRAKTLVDAAHDSVGKSGGQGAVMEIQMLLEDYKVKKQQLEMVTSVMEELIMQIPNAEKMLSVDGVGLVTVAGFISEVGDISRFKNPKQIQKYAGFELVENSSGKHKGRTTISKRGRKKLRKIIYQVVLPLIQSNKEFRSIYDYYRKRIKNPLKGRQAMIAVGCKLIRVFFAIMTKGVVYNGSKMIEDIHRPTQLPQAA